MKVLHLAPLWLPVAVDSRGGIETLLGQLLPAQDALGVETTLVAPGDSDGALSLTAAVDESLVSVMDRAEAYDYSMYEQHQLAIAWDLARDVDVVHSHVGAGAFLLDHAFAGAPPVVHTLHWAPTTDLAWLLARRPAAHVVAVSEAQAQGVRGLGGHVTAVVHNGINMADVPMVHAPGRGLVFLGRIEWNKGADLAVELARRLNLPLQLAGPVTDRAYFATAIEPRLNDMIRYVGVVDSRGKFDLLRQAECLIAPSRYEEPFGMVAVEAMAAGVPVVTLGNGALPEVVDEGISGAVAESEDALADAVARARELDGRAIIEHARHRFDIKRVAAEYIVQYEKAIAEGIHGR